jgi:hypothetical protein
MAHSLAMPTGMPTPSKRTSIALAVAAVIGAGAATATYAIVDNGSTDKSGPTIFINSHGSSSSAPQAPAPGGGHP